VNNLTASVCSASPSSYIISGIYPADLVVEAAGLIAPKGIVRQDVSAQLLFILARCGSRFRRRRCQAVPEEIHDVDRLPQHVQANRFAREARLR